MKNEENAAEVAQIQVEQEAEDSNLVQYKQRQIPHENDTDDVDIKYVDFGYNHQHSKAWNQEVNKKAEELESEMKIQENLKLSQKKAQEDAKIKA